MIYTHRTYCLALNYLPNLRAVLEMASPNKEELSLTAIRFLKTLLVVADIMLFGIMMLTLTVQKNQRRKFVIPTVTFAAIYLLNALTIISDS